MARAGFRRIRDGVWPEVTEATREQLENEVVIQMDRAERAEQRVAALEQMLRQTQESVENLLREGDTLRGAVTRANTRAAELSGQMAELAQRMDEALTAAIVARAR